MRILPHCKKPRRSTPILLSIEYRDRGESQRVEVTSGQVDWEEPSARVHRVLNIAKQPYGQVMVFLLPDNPGRVAPYTRAEVSFGCRKLSIQYAQPNTIGKRMRSTVTRTWTLGGGTPLKLSNHSAVNTTMNVQNTR